MRVASSRKWETSGRSSGWYDYYFLSWASSFLGSTADSVGDLLSLFRKIHVGRCNIIITTSSELLTSIGIYVLIFDMLRSIVVLCEHSVSDEKWDGYYFLLSTCCGVVVFRVFRVAKNIVRLGSAPYESKSHWNRDKLSHENPRTSWWRLDPDVQPDRQQEATFVRSLTAGSRRALQVRRAYER